MVNRMMSRDRIGTNEGLAVQGLRSLCRGLLHFMWRLAAAAVLVCGVAQGGAMADGPRHALAMHGDPALPPGFDHLPYANPSAPKGGRLVAGVVGTFDSLNPMIVKGIAVPQIRGYVVESLMARGHDEPFTLYGLIAQSVTVNDARSEVTFTINPAAAFSDGHPVTARDVLFSWKLLRDHGRPNHRLYYSKVAHAEALDDRTVRFDLSEANDRELPLILGLMPVLPEHATDPATFEQTSLAPPIGSGPYIVDAVDPGVSVTLKRNPAYWGRDLPVNRGLWNFDELRIDYYRDANSHFEAFKRGLYDFRVETEPLRWTRGYDFEAARKGEVIKDTIRTALPRVSEFFVFNTRRAIFKDERVREALTLLFNFEWLNKAYFFGLYDHSASYFAGSELAAYGVPASDGERALLAPFRNEVRADVMAGTFRLPRTDASGRDRAGLRRAFALLRAAGYALVDGSLLGPDGTPLAFEILVNTRDQERIALAYARDLKRAGIKVSIRVVDAVQFDQRKLAFDFDMIPVRWDQSLSPGNEQAFYWGSAAADEQGTRNYMGVRSAAIDAMIAAMIGARERPDFVAATRALDRLLMSGFYAIPIYNVPAQWIARWRRIAEPDRSSLAGYLPETWWYAGNNGRR